jgi:hypothetical protein
LAEELLGRVLVWKVEGVGVGTSHDEFVASVYVPVGVVLGPYDSLSLGRRVRESEEVGVSMGQLENVPSVKVPVCVGGGA